MPPVGWEFMITGCGFTITGCGTYVGVTTGPACEPPAYSKTKAEVKNSLRISFMDAPHRKMTRPVARVGAHPTVIWQRYYRATPPIAAYKGSSMSPLIPLFTVTVSMALSSMQWTSVN